MRRNHKNDRDCFMAAIWSSWCRRCSTLCAHCCRCTRLLTGTQPAAAQIPDCETAYCKFEMVAGEDWQLLDGMETGITQVARQSQGAFDV
jgi:hypothetical protein